MRNLTLTIPLNNCIPRNRLLEIFFEPFLLHSMVAGCNNGRNNPPLAGKDYLMHTHFDCTDITRIKDLEKKINGL